MGWNWFSEPSHIVFAVEPRQERLSNEVRVICESLAAGDGEWRFDKWNNIVHRRSNVKMSNSNGKWKSVRPHCVFTDKESMAIEQAVLCMIASLVTPADSDEEVQIDERVLQ